MEEDIKDVSEAKEEVMNEDSLVHFEFGDLYIKCSCGHEEKFIPGIEGIQVVLPATNKHNLKIVCSKCKHKLSLFFKESENIEELRKEKEDRQKAFDEANKPNEVKTDESGNIE